MCRKADFCSSGKLLHTCSQCLLLKQVNKHAIFDVVIEIKWTFLLLSFSSWKIVQHSILQNLIKIDRSHFFPYLQWSHFMQRCIVHIASMVFRIFKGFVKIEMEHSGYPDIQCILSFLRSKVGNETVFNFEDIVWDKSQSIWCTNAATNIQEKTFYWCFCTKWKKNRCLMWTSENDSLFKKPNGLFEFLSHSMRMMKHIMLFIIHCSQHWHEKCCYVVKSSSITFRSTFITSKNSFNSRHILKTSLNSLLRGVARIFETCPMNHKCSHGKFN